LYVTAAEQSKSHMGHSLPNCAVGDMSVDSPIADMAHDSDANKNAPRERNCFVTSPRVRGELGLRSNPGEGPLRDSEPLTRKRRRWRHSAMLKQCERPLIPTFSPHAGRRWRTRRGRGPRPLHRAPRGARPATCVGDEAENRKIGFAQQPGFLAFCPKNPLAAQKVSAFVCAIAVFVISSIFFGDTALAIGGGEAVAEAKFHPSILKSVPVFRATENVQPACWTLGCYGVSTSVKFGPCRRIGSAFHHSDFGSQDDVTDALIFQIRKFFASETFIKQVLNSEFHSLSSQMSDIFKFDIAGDQIIEAAADNMISSRAAWNSRDVCALDNPCVFNLVSDSPSGNYSKTDCGDKKQTSEDTYCLPAKNPIISRGTQGFLFGAGIGAVIFGAIIFWVVRV